MFPTKYPSKKPGLIQAGQIGRDSCAALLVMLGLLAGLSFVGLDAILSTSHAQAYVTPRALVGPDLVAVSTPRHKEDHARHA